MMARPVRSSIKTPIAQKKSLSPSLSQDFHHHHSRLDIKIPESQLYTSESTATKMSTTILHPPSTSADTLPTFHHHNHDHHPSNPDLTRLAINLHPTAADDEEHAPNHTTQPAPVLPHTPPSPTATPPTMTRQIALGALAAKLDAWHAIIDPSFAGRSTMSRL